MDVTKDRLAEVFASASLRIAIDRLSARDGDDYTEGHVRYPALAAEAVLRALVLTAGPDAPTEDQVRADERRKCTRELRDYSDGLMHFAIGLVTAGDEINGLPKVSRAAAIESAARLLEKAVEDYGPLCAGCGDLAGAGAAPIELGGVLCKTCADEDKKQGTAEE